MVQVELVEISWQNNFQERKKEKGFIFIGISKCSLY